MDGTACTALDSLSYVFLSKRRFPAIGEIQESVGFLVRMIEFPHQRPCCRKRIADKKKEGLVRIQCDSFSDDKDELANR